MKDYLTVMNVDELAILAQEKGEQEQDTIHTIELTSSHVTIYKHSRVNNNLCVRLQLGQEHIERLRPGDRLKKQLATAVPPAELRIESSLETLNGLATVIDHRELVDGGSCMRQTLSITNEQSGETSTTTRYFLPYNGTPPHLLVNE